MLSLSIMLRITKNRIVYYFWRPSGRHFLMVQKLTAYHEKTTKIGAALLQIRMENEEMEFTEEQKELIYNQLSARKLYFEEDMMDWAKQKNTKEVKRCADVAEQIDEVMKIILNG